MELDKIVISVDENPFFLDFLPTASKMWRRHGFEPQIALVGEATEEINKWGNITAYAPIEGFSPGVYAKILRFLHAASLDTVCTMVDIDYLLFDIDYLKNGVKGHTDVVVTFGANIYQNDLPGRPNCILCTGHSNQFHQIFNPNSLSHSDLLNNWKIKFPYFGWNLPFKEDNATPGFIQEHLWLYLMQIDRTTHLMHYVDREDWDGELKKCHKRINRPNMEYDSQKLAEGFYIDCCPMRPYNEEKMAPFLNYLSI